MRGLLVQGKFRTDHEFAPSLLLSMATGSPRTIDEDLKVLIEGNSKLQRLSFMRSITMFILRN